MKLSLLLFILGIKLKLAALAGVSFRKKLRRKDFVLCIRTEDGARAHTYRLKGGRVSSRFGRDPAADTELVWRDADIAVRIMLSKYDLDGYSAIGKGILRIQGNFENALLFLELAE